MARGLLHGSYRYAQAGTGMASPSRGGISREGLIQDCQFLVLQEGEIGHIPVLEYYSLGTF